MPEYPQPSTSTPPEPSTSRQPAAADPLRAAPALDETERHGTGSPEIDGPESHRIEHALAQERDLVARLVETSPSGILVVDNAGLIVFANREAERILDLRRTAAAGREYDRPQWELLNPDGSPVPEGERTFRRVLATGQPIRDVRHLLRWRSGRSVLLAINAAPLYSTAGEIEAVVSTLHDITERERAEAALRRSEERYRHLFNSGNDAILVHGLRPDGSPDRLTQVNDIACKLLAAPRETLLELSPLELTPAELRERAAAAAERLRRDRHALSETELLAGDGRRIPVEINSSLFELDGRTTALSIVRDITERRRLEDQLRQSQKLEVFGQLAGGVAHDFNNLLVAIIGNAGLLLESPALDARLRETAAQIEEAGRRAAALTRQLLLFARKQPAELAPCDLGTIVAEHAKLLRRLIGENVELVLELATEPLPIVADVNMVEQVAMNLVVNSRDAMPRGGTLTLRTARATLDSAAAAAHLCPPGDYAALVVRDTGCGIPAAHRPHIFEPFYTTKPSGQGTGLGLSTVLGIVQQHHGGIALESEEGRGTQFSIYLPLASAPAETAPAAPPHATAAASPAAKPATLLVVEDDDTVRNIIERTLDKSGYRILLATCGTEGIAQLERHADRIDLVLSDVVMPGEIDGLQLAEIVAARWPALPVLLMSGYAKNLDHAGMRILAKPFTTARLLAYIQEGLATRLATHTQA